ncbi:MAG: acyltransferase [Solirubrobacterales bacterium]|nr:acyltransferase [Solirubrobacterales bacterium]
MSDHAVVGPRSHQRFPLFDSLRGLAAISILLVHVAIFTDGFGDDAVGRIVAHLDIGVPFFFLLSAFLLYRPFVASRREHRARGRFDTYAERRFLRIAPAYWAVLTIAAVVPGMAGAFSGNWWVYYGLLQNYPVYTPDGTCAVDPFRCAIPPAWSLSIEVFFYVLLPFFVLLMAWLARRWRGPWMVPEIVVVGLLSIASFWIQSRVPISDAATVLFFSPIGRGWWFGLGLLLAAFSVWAGQRERLPRALDVVERYPWALVGSAIALYLALVWFVLEPAPTGAFPVGDVGRYFVEYVGFGVIALLIVLPATFGGEGPGRYRAFLRHPIPTWLGVVSYGIFLWQFPVLVAALDLGVDDWWPAQSFLVVSAVTFAGTVVCAAASYYALERPLMRWGRRHEDEPDETPPPEPVAP